MSSDQSQAAGKFHHREMEDFKRMTHAGVTVAVPAALHYCRQTGMPVPPWLVQASLILLCDLLKREKSKSCGRSTGPVARYRQDMIDMTRWNEVTVLREKQAKVRDNLTYYANTPVASSPRYAAEMERGKWLGKSLERALECASELLEGTQAFGSPETMRRSYRRLQRESTNPSTGLQYYPLDTLFLRMLGIDDMSCRKLVRTWQRPRRSSRSPGANG